MQSITNFSKTILKARKTISRLNEQKRGAVVTAYATNTNPVNDSALLYTTKTSFDFKCQIQSQVKYCLKHGYSHHIRSDFYQDESIAIHWTKVLAILELLPHYPWVLYVDVDSAFLSPSTSPSIEDLLNSTDIGNAFTIMPDNHFGWSGDFIFVRNSAIGIAFIQHLWSLRHHCPSCVGEQCALHVALFDLIAHEAQMWLQSNQTTIEVNVARDQNHSCCLPISHCEFPFGDKRVNVNHGLFPQGCTWNWQKALSINGDRKLIYASFALQMRSALNIKHPVKKMTC